MFEPSVSNPLRVKAQAVNAEARDILLVSLTRIDGGPLPPSTPGGHIEIRLPNGLIRHYSLINDCTNPDQYLIAVGLARDSGGGSSYIHSHLRQDSELEITGVRNNFGIDPRAGRYLFIAGGIGITPIMSMIRWCRNNDREWFLIYAVRSFQRAAFYEDLHPLGANVRFHSDDEAGHVLDVKRVLETLAPDEQIYCCGPEPLMKAVAAVTDQLPSDRVHFEWFKAPDNGQMHTDASNGDAFEIILQRSGRSLTVPADRSILEVIEEAGIAHPHSCREGNCRTCETGIIEGEVEHRDYVLSSEERVASRSMMICVSRAKGGRLVLDL